MYATIRTGALEGDPSQTELASFIRDFAYLLVQEVGTTFGAHFAPEDVVDTLIVLDQEVELGISHVPREQLELQVQEFFKQMSSSLLALTKEEIYASIREVGVPWVIPETITDSMLEHLRNSLFDTLLETILGVILEEYCPAFTESALNVVFDDGRAAFLADAFGDIVDKELFNCLLETKLFDVALVCFDELIKFAFLPEYTERILLEYQESTESRVAHDSYSVKEIVDEINWKEIFEAGLWMLKLKDSEEIDLGIVERSIAWSELFVEDIIRLLVHDSFFGLALNVRLIDLPIGVYETPAQAVLSLADGSWRAYLGSVYENTLYEDYDFLLQFTKKDDVILEIFTALIDWMYTQEAKEYAFLGVADTARHKPSTPIIREFTTLLAAIGETVKYLADHVERPSDALKLLVQAGASAWIAFPAIKYVVDAIIQDPPVVTLVTPHAHSVAELRIKDDSLHADTGAFYGHENRFIMGRFILGVTPMGG